jgi:hypothetical protein
MGDHHLIASLGCLALLQQWGSCSGADATWLRPSSPSLEWFWIEWIAVSSGFINILPPESEPIAPLGSASLPGAGH